MTPAETGARYREASCGGAGTEIEVLLTVTGEETFADGHKDSSRTRSRAVYEKIVDGKSSALEALDGADTDGTDRIGIDGTGWESCVFHVFRYRETDPQSGAVTESVMKFYENGCVIERCGEIRTKMRFEPDKETGCVYDTPFGSIHLTIRTRLVAMRQVGDNFHARIRYELTPAGSDPIERVVTVKAEPVK